MVVFCENLTNLDAFRPYWDLISTLLNNSHNSAGWLYKTSFTITFPTSIRGCRLRLTELHIRIFRVRLRLGAGAVDPCT